MAYKSWEEEQAAQAAELARLRELNIAARQQQEQFAQQAQQPTAPQGPTGMGDIRGQITGGARSSDGSMWDFMDQGGNKLTSMPLQDFYNQYGNANNQGALGWGSSVNNVPVWNPMGQQPQPQQQPAPQEVSQSRPSSGLNAFSGYSPFQSLNFGYAPYQERMQNASPSGGLLGQGAAFGQPGMNAFFQRYWGK